MTSSSSIDSHFAPPPGGGGGGNGSRGAAMGGSTPLQQYTHVQYQPLQQGSFPPTHHQQPPSFHHRHPVVVPTTTSTGSSSTPMATPVINGKLPNGVAKPTPAVRTISRQRSAGRDESMTLPSRVSQVYYRHGLFLSSYPTCATSIAVAVIIFCCYPLLNIPLPGTFPTKVIFPYTEQIGQNLHMTSVNSSAATSEMYNPFSFNGNNIFNIYNISLEPPFPWARIDPLLYVQQIIMRASVVPWNENMQLTDAYRGPLYEVFKMIEIIRNHEDESKNTLSHLCLHVENVKRASQQMLFPEYNCLLLSPANLWQQNIQNFNKDSNLLNTVYVNHNLQKSKVSTSEMLFGISLRDTGVKRYPMRVRSRIVQYAVTLIMRENNPAYINSLKEKLAKTYPLHQPPSDRHPQQKLRDDQSSIMYIFYPGEFDWKEFLPQCVAIGMLFLYVYFSVRKIEEIRSRFVLASSAVMTVLGSLLMSLGMCFFFGLTISLQSKGVYPYLVILVGLENVLVITKSVLTTDNNLDVKIRMAQGLSREGWSITKNLLMEITILTVGLCTFVPVIQEFCIFAIVGLLSDFFLQMMFFSTVLALDIKRVEYSAEVRQLPKMLYYNSERRSELDGSRNGGISRSMSHPKLSGMDQGGHVKKNSLTTSGNGKDKKIPKRLRIVNFWARTRFFQRGFMIWMVLWISNIIYNSGLIEYMIDKNMEAQRAAREASRIDIPVNDLHDLKSAEAGHLNFDHFADGELHGNNEQRILNITEQLNRLKHPDYETVYQLSNFHWSSILKQYNISLSGRYVTVLPSIKLSHAVSPQVAQKLRNPDEKVPHHFQWKALAAALDPLDFSDADTSDALNINTGNAPFYPKTPMEILLSCMLIAVSIFMVTYTLVVLYRCMCTRNYAEWRASWTQDSENEEPKQEQRVLEGVPIQVNGHKHRIECLVTDGNMIASSCLQGQVKIWDVTNGELMAEIHRTNHFDMQRKEQRTSPRDSVVIKGEPSSGNITGMQEVFPEQSPTSFAFKLKKKLQFNFTAPNHNQEQPAKDPSLFDFAAQYEKNFTSDRHQQKRLGNNGGVLGVDIRNRFLSNAAAAPYYDAAIDHARSGGHPSDIRRSHSGGGEEDQAAQKPGSTARKKCYQTSPIWCLDFLDNLIVIGCADGRLEFWEGTTGNFKGIYETEHTRNNGVTNIKLTGDKVVAARLSGRIDFLRLETYTQGRQIDWGFTSAYRRTHIRTGSAGSIGMFQIGGGPNGAGSSHTSEEELRCILEFHQQGHQMPVTCLEVAGGTVMTGSQDHTVKVFRLDSNVLQFTLHGHCGPISCLFIDQWQVGMGASGCQDGLLCVWDLVRGGCMYKIEAHDDSIVALACSPSYVISLGLDERIRVWDRFQGQPLNTMTVSHAYSSLVMLTPSLLVTGKPGSMIVWDVRTGEVAREVKLDCSNSQLSPKMMLPAAGSVICDYGNQMRIVRFPLVAADKCE